jgi:esterase/lipase
MAETATKAKRKPATKRKPVAKRKLATPSKPKKAATTFAATAQDTGRTVLLAGLGFYGKAYDQAQEQLNGLQQLMAQRRKQADKVYKELVKRGEKLEKDAKSALKEIELPRLELSSLDRKKLEQQLTKAKARLNEFKDTVRVKIAA